MKKLVYVFIIVVALSSIKCVYLYNSIIGNGIPQKRTFSVSGFENITLRGSMEAFIVQGTEYTLEVELDSNLYEFFDTYVSDNTLHLGFSHNVSVQGSYKIRIQLPNLAYLRHSGSGATKITGFAGAGKEMSIVKKGSGTMSVDAVVKKLEIDLKGSGSLTARGAAEILSFNGKGSGAFNALELESEQVHITHAGSGDMEVTAKKSLEATVSGSGKLRYRGTPSRIMIHSSRSGTVERVE
ncbi:MAG: head GIN domain-containing protein [Treponema sp.]